MHNFSASARTTQAGTALRLLIITALAVLPIAACTPASDDTTAAGADTSDAASDLSTGPVVEQTVDEGPGTASVFFAGPEAIPATVSMPAGWSVLSEVFVVKLDTDPLIGLALFDAANIYSDPCRWVQLDPPVGPAVDDLVTAFQESTVFDTSPASDVTLDGFPGKYIEVTVPDYDESDCMHFGLFKEDGETDAGPDWWAQAPKQTIDMWILDVNGIRLVVSAGYYPHTTDEDREELTEMLATLDIG